MRSTWRVVVVSTMVVSLMALGGCSRTMSAQESAAPTPSTKSLADQAMPIRIAVAGDSNSTGMSGTLSNGVAGGTAWVSLLPAEDFEWVGGWAQDGATAAQIAAGVPPVPTADVLLVMAGTNDLALGISAEETLSSVKSLAERSGAAWVVVAALPPLDLVPGGVAELNRRLEDLATAHDWGWVDPWTTVSTEDGWLPAFWTDGVHTSPEGYQEAAGVIAGYLSANVLPVAR